MTDIPTLARALTMLGTCLSHTDRNGLIVLTVPKDTWFRLKHALWAYQIAVPVLPEAPGITVSHPPPPGEDYNTGFWCVGCWVKRPPEAIAAILADDRT